MLSSTLLTIIMATVAPFAAAAPAPEVATAEWTLTEGTGLPHNSTSGLQKRAAGGVYICTDADWKGTCGYAVQPLNTCIHLDFPWWHSISSFGPDQGTKCDWYSGYYCDGFIASKVGHPGISNLATFGGNDQIGSFKCVTG